MKVTLIIILLITLGSCSQRDQVVFSMPAEEELNKIVEAVILQDSLPIFRDNIKEHHNEEYSQIRIDSSTLSRKLYTDLGKRIVLFTKSNSKQDAPPPPPHSVEFMSLINFQEPNTPQYFLPSDSTYIKFQNENPQRFSYKGKLLGQLNIVETIEPLDKYEAYYSISLPILSENQKLAYLEATYHCTGLCGETIGYLLCKQSNNWAIIANRTIWVS